MVGVYNKGQGYGSRVRAEGRCRGSRAWVEGRIGGSEQRRIKGTA